VVLNGLHDYECLTSSTVQWIKEYLKSKLYAEVRIRYMRQAEGALDSPFTFSSAHTALTESDTLYFSQNTEY